jgi:predicted RND superfamily exporter protein
MGSQYFPLLLSLLALLIVVFFFFYFRSYLRVRTSKERFLSELQEEVNSILKSINEITDRDVSLIEERERNLKNILEEVDKRLKLYIKELELHKESESTYSYLSASMIKPVSPEKKPLSYEEIGRKHSGGSPSYFIPEFKVKPEPAPEMSVSEQIQSLVKSGYPAPLIASRLGISIAEVEFALALLERRGNQ